MVTRWSERDTLKLIHLYKSYEFLWDKDTELYKNIYARKQAYDAIVNEMQIPDLTAQDVRSKIKNLRTSYYQELRKIASCKANNKPPKQVKWFLAFKSVMGNVSHDPGVPKVAEEQAEHLMNVEEDSFSEVEEDEEEEMTTVELDDNGEESITNSDAYVVSIKQEFLDEMDNLSDKGMQPPIVDFLEPVVQKRPKQPEIKKPEATSVPMHSYHATSSSSSSSKKTKQLDEFQMFANNIAQQLRKLPLSKALNLQIEVQRMIAKERIEMLRKQVEKSNNEESYS